MSEPENVVIVGATSGISRPLAARLAARGWQLLLVGRDAEELRRIAADLQIRFGRRPGILTLDLLDFARHRQFAQQCGDHFGGALTGVVYCVGYLADQGAAEADPDKLRQTFDVNLTATASILLALAEQLTTHRGSWMAVLSSVAGDRGRQSNFIYGAAKAGLTTFLSGLRNRLHPAGVAVLTIKPGPVDTSMIAGHLDPASWQVSSPETVAHSIERAIVRRRDVAYVPWYWRPIMAAIRAIPEPIFKRLKL